MANLENLPGAGLDRHREMLIPNSLLPGGQTAHDFCNDRIRARLDLGARLILDGVRHVDGVVVWTPERGRLGSCGGREFMRGDGDGRDPEPFEGQ
jgi:hypothetical protein